MLPPIAIRIAPVVCAIVLIAKHWKKMFPVNIKKDGLVVFAVIHMVYLYVIYRRSRKAVK